MNEEVCNPMAAGIEMQSVVGVDSAFAQHRHSVRSEARTMLAAAGNLNDHEQSAVELDVEDLSYGIVADDKHKTLLSNISFHIPSVGLGAVIS
jgi:predicted regulator of Ras-like GTPase activity (Roadblock/LC7/MglB family)